MHGIMCYMPRQRSEYVCVGGLNARRGSGYACWAILGHEYNACVRLHPSLEPACLSPVSFWVEHAPSRDLLARC